MTECLELCNAFLSSGLRSSRVDRVSMRRKLLTIGRIMENGNNYVYVYAHDKPDDAGSYFRNNSYKLFHKHSMSFNLLFKQNLRPTFTPLIDRSN